MKDFDVIVIGGGLSGATLALQLQKASPSLSIAVIERSPLPLPEAAHKVGESTVEIGAHYLAQKLNMESHIKRDQLPKLGLRCFFPSEKKGVHERLELGATRFFNTPSYQLDRGRLENFMLEEIKKGPISLFEESVVKSIQSIDGTDKGPWNVEISNRSAATKTLIKGKWLIDASGRNGFLKRRLNLDKKSEHQGGAAWWRLSKEISIETWWDGPEWRMPGGEKYSRWFSTNHLMGYGYWVWLIPLASGSTSFGIVADNRIHPVSSFSNYDRAMEWLKVNEPQLAETLANCEKDLQDFRTLKNYPLNATRVMSRDHWALTGEAGLFLDPLYSPGSDLISIFNTLLTDIIVRDHAGENVSVRLEAYNKIYFEIYNHTRLTFYDQYQIFSNPLVMSVKVIWDHAMYWSFLCFLFFHDLYTNLDFFSKNAGLIKRVADINAKQQQFFLEWNKLQHPKAKRGLIDISQSEYLEWLNNSLLQPMDENIIGAEFEERVKKLEQLSLEISDFASMHSRGVKVSDSVTASEGLVAPLLKEIENACY